MNKFDSRKNLISYLKHLSFNLINDEYHFMLYRYNKLLSIFNSVISLINSTNIKCEELIKQNSLPNISYKFKELLEESLSSAVSIQHQIEELSDSVSINNVVYFNTGFTRDNLIKGILNYYKELFISENRCTLIYKVENLINCYQKYNEIILYKLYNVYDKKNLEYLKKLYHAPSFLYGYNDDDDGEIDFIDEIRIYVFNINNIVNTLVLLK